MEVTTCKNFETCPIFTGRLQDKEITAKSYKAQYCNAGSNGWNSCKRYLVKEKTGKCPPDLLPNSMKPLEEIINGMDL